MSVNHVALRGLVNPDKEMYLSHEEEEDGMEQDPVKKTVQSILMGHKIHHLSLWQCICQNDDGSWKGYYLNGIDVKLTKVWQLTGGDVQRLKYNTISLREASWTRATWL
jgi:hypothetical protein